MPTATPPRHHVHRSKQRAAYDRSLVHAILDAGLLADHGYSEPATTRGESAYLIEAADHYLAHVEEGLGTKNLVADAMYAQSGKCFYREVAIDTVATINHRDFRVVRPSHVDSFTLVP